MYSTVITGGVSGVRSFSARVEVDLSRSLPSFDMVGRLSKEVTEARERVRVALKNSGIALPSAHITVNISPADIYKSGTGYDLPIAIGILAALEYIPPENLENVLIIGELGLDGSTCPVRGILPIVLEAKSLGITTCIVPSANAPEAAFAGEMRILAVNSFNEAFQALVNPEFAEDIEYVDLCKPSINETYKEDFADVCGQEACKRAALVAAAGSHHLLITGPPGAGKSMIARRIRTIMPSLSWQEILEVSSVYSIAGKLDEQTPIMSVRPFCDPHHKATISSFTGGGRIPHPGILTMSHKGILFLDEFPEFDRACIEALREPLESKQLKVSRSAGTITYPADFLLVAAANPCPCGFYPNMNKCRCTPYEINRYRSKISGPILDRIDMTVTATQVDITKSSINPVYTSEVMRKQVEAARSLQLQRFEGTEYTCNGQIRSSDIERYCHLGDNERKYASEMYNALELSARSYHKLLKVARTIADLDGSDEIHLPHLTEAVCYRS